jgi:hypothetical protein
MVTVAINHLSLLHAIYVEYVIMYVYSRGGPHSVLAPRPSLIYCASICNNTTDHLVDGLGPQFEKHWSRITKTNTTDHTKTFNLIKSLILPYIYKILVMVYLIRRDPLRYTRQDKKEFIGHCTIFVLNVNCILCSFILKDSRGKI